MKNIILLLLLLLIRQSCLAQWTEEDIAPYRQRAAEEVSLHIKKMIQSGMWDKEEDAMEIEFVTDTLQLGIIVRLLEEDGHYSTMEMHYTLSYQMAEYDRLLNKYYQLLMNKLSSEDRVKFRNAQRVWLKYRDSETEINNGILAPNQYMGGGTMWPLVAKGRTLALIRERVCSIYELIQCI